MEDNVTIVTIQLQHNSTTTQHKAKLQFNQIYDDHINFFPAPSRDAEWTRDAVNFISRVPTAQVPTKLQENNVTKVTLLNKWRGTSLEIKLN